MFRFAFALLGGMGSPRVITTSNQHNSTNATAIGSASHVRVCPQPCVGKCCVQPTTFTDGNNAKRSRANARSGELVVRPPGCGNVKEPARRVGSAVFVAGIRGCEIVRPQGGEVCSAVPGEQRRYGVVVASWVVRPNPGNAVQPCRITNPLN